MPLKRIVTNKTLYKAFEKQRSSSKLADSFCTIQFLILKSSSNPKVRIFRLQEQTYFSLAKMCLFVMVPILINKDVFEPSYNNLKFMVRNGNYIFTNQ